MIPHRSLALISRVSLAAAAILLAGCPKAPDPTANPAPPHSAVVRLLVVDDPALAKQIVRVKGEWKARSGADLEICEMTLSELTAAKSLAADAVIYPSDELGSLAERNLIRPLPAAWLEHDEFHRSDLFEPGGLAESQWGQETYAVPFGSPVFVLYYRRDLFEKAHLEPPRTWADYQRLVEFFAKQKDGLAANSAAAVEPLADGWAGKLLLARAAAYAKHRDYYATLFDKETMEPLIASPPFVRALDELVAAAKPDAAADLAASPADARLQILDDRSAMSICWPTAADSRAAALQNAKVNPRLFAVAELPGSTEVYNPRERTWQPRSADSDSKTASADSSPQSSRTVAAVPVPCPLLGIAGRLGSVTKGASDGQFAFRLLAWLSGHEWSVPICSASPATTLFRQDQLSQPARWVEPQLAAAAGQYADVVVRSFTRPQWLECLRIPGHAEYMAALDEAVRAAVAGKQNPADALSHAADRWREITVRLGLDSQRAAYKRSVGLEP